MEKFEDKIKELNQDIEFTTFLTDEEDNEKLKNTFITYGIREGITQKSFEIARKLLEKNMSVKEVSEITGLTKEEVEDLL